MKTSFPLAFIVFTLFFSTYSNGFSVDLIPRDSPKSPFFDSSLSPFDSLGQALRRSQIRHNHFASSVNSLAAGGGAISPIISGGGEFLMKISLGTPPVSIVAIADTGSDLLWIQCRPCQSCYKQIAPLFDPRKSSTYKKVPCKSKLCSSETRSSCSKGACQYRMSYGDQSHSEGILSNETIGLGSVTHKELVFGCGLNNAGTFMNTSSGIVGLGGGSFSLITQMDEVIHGKFSYCLVSNFNSKSSVMHFGDDATVSGAEAGAVSTPIIKKYPATFFYLTLEGLTVGNGPRLDIRDDNDDYSEVESAGNIIIDSGTTLTYLPQSIYSKLIREVKSVVKLTPTIDPLMFLELCYATTSMKGLPDITVHFTGADVKLLPLNTFIETGSGVACLAFRPSESLAIYGNIAQINFLVGYDLKKKTVSFKPTECGQ